MSQPWLEIESAPRDGSMILAAEGSTVAAVKFWDGQWWVQGAHAYYLVPTHWQPCPAPPFPDEEHDGPHLVVLKGGKS